MKNTECKEGNDDANKASSVWTSQNIVFTLITGLGTNILTNVLGLSLFQGIIIFSASTSVGIALIILCRKKLVMFRRSIKDMTAKIEAARLVLRREDPVRLAKEDMSLLKSAKALINCGNMLFNKALCNEIENGNNCEELCKALKGCYFIFGGRDFWRVASNWCEAGAGDEDGPKEGIVKRGEQEETGYSSKNLQEVSKRIVGHLRDWYDRNRKGRERLVIRYIGADYVDLAEAVLSCFRISGVIYVYVGGVFNPDNLEILRCKFNNGTGIKVIDGTEPINEDYDVIICTHYWQHHPAKLLDDEIRTSKLKPHGMLIWLAATSRSAKLDEYVCEGCLPMLASTYKNKKEAPADSIQYAVMGEYDADHRYIHYDQIQSYQTHFLVLSWGFPKVLAVPVQVCEDDAQLQTYLLDYFNWGKETDAVTSFRESRPGMVESLRDVKVKVLDVCVCRRIRRKKAPNCYILLALRYQVSQECREMPLIAVVGREEKAWDIDLGKNEISITLHPALRLRAEKISHIKAINDIGESVLKEIVIDAGREEHIEKYKDYISESCAGGWTLDNGGKVWQIDARIKDVELNDFVVMAIDSTHADGIAGIEVYYSFLPTRRYLTKDDFNRGLRRLNRFDAWKKNLKTDCRFSAVPRRTDSYTWLWSYGHFLEFCKCHDLTVVNREADVYFHKGFGCLTETAKNAFPNVLLMENAKYLTNDICCVDKDREFNELPLDVRLKLLGCMNIHDMLLFAEKK